MSGRVEREMFLDTGKLADAYQFFVDRRICFDAEKLIEVLLMLAQQLLSFAFEE